MASVKGADRHKSTVGEIKSYNTHVRLMVTVVMCAIAAFLIFSFALFNYSLTNVMTKNGEAYLTEVATQVNKIVDERIGSLTEEAQRVARYCAERKDFDTFAFDDYLGYIKDYTYFKTMSYIDSEGNVIDSVSEDGYASPLVWSGEMADTTSVYYALNAVGEAVIVHVVPVFEQSVQAGCVVTNASAVELGEILGEEFFNKQGYVLITDVRGDVLFDADNDSAHVGISNFFSAITKLGDKRSKKNLETMRADMNAGKSGLVYYKLEGEVDKVVNYSPLEETGWYLLAIAPKDFHSDYSANVFLYAALLCASIILLFALVVLFVFFINDRNEKKLIANAYVDDVTGGATALKFEDVMRDTLAKASNGEYMLATLDVKKFYIVNDLYGLDYGDAVLSRIYAAISCELDADEFVCRTDGDRFLILLKTRGNEEVRKLCEKWGEKINGGEGLKGGLLLQCFGGFYVIDNPRANPVTIRDRSSIALKEASAAEGAGLICYAFFDDEYLVTAMEERDMFNRMESALTNGDFEVVFQPKLNLADGSLYGAEALVRWSDADGNLYLPNSFIPFFERIGFIGKLDLYMFGRVCAAMREWTDAGITPCVVSVNLSRVDVTQEGFVEKLVETAEEFGVPAALVEFEVTESAMLEDTSAVKAFFAEIKRRGFGCSIDDFGSGWSALNMLKDIDADTVKLDKSLLDDDPYVGRGGKILENIVHMLLSLDFKVVAEGAETQIQSDFLKKCGCNAVQGYVYARPMERTAFEKLLSENRGGAASK